MDKKKTGWKPNFFDFLLVALVLAAIVGLAAFRVWRSRPSGDGSTEPEQWPRDAVVRYTVELNEMPLDAAQAIQPGDELIERSLNKSAGVVESVEVRLSRTVVRDQNTGEQYYTEIPDRYTAVIVITADAKENVSNFTINNGLVVRVGTYVQMAGTGYYGTGYIVRVERSDDA